MRLSGLSLACGLMASDKEGLSQDRGSIYGDESDERYIDKRYSS